MSTNARQRPVDRNGQAQKISGTHDLLNYRLAERVGQDDLATIYRALHLTLDRPVQVRVLRRTDWVSVSRFQLAGKIAARLNHPNILPVIDAGHDDRYGDYIVTPQLNTRSLDEVLASGTVEPIQALKIVTQMAAALDYLHAQGIVHRDLQPLNIAITQQGTAFLANFSLAAAPETPDFSGVEDSDYLTLYSAPEQRLSGDQPAGTLDIYSLGAILYQLLSGDPPPAHGTEPVSVETRHPEYVGIDRVIRRMLAPQPSQRFSSAAQAVGALRQSMRSVIDESTTDMQESDWDTSAEWLENPLETVIAQQLDAEFLAKSRARANQLHRVDAVRKVLDRWSRKGFVRRKQLGKLIQPEHIVSFDVYLYELRAHFETRASPQPRHTAYHGGALPPTELRGLWETQVPEHELFVNAPPEAFAVQGSQKIIDCTLCHRTAKVECQTCGGKGTIERRQRIAAASGQREETVQDTCQTCRGYGRVECQRCEGSGQLLEEMFFTWSRSSRAFFNEDDLSGLDKRAVQRSVQPVFAGRIDPKDAQWYQVGPLKELIEEAVKGGGPDSRLLAADLAIRGAPVTELDYRYNDKPHTLMLLGFNNQIRGDVALYDVERILLYVIIVVMVIAIAVALTIR